MGVLSPRETHILGVHHCDGETLFGCVFRGVVGVSVLHYRSNFVRKALNRAGNLDSVEVFRSAKRGFWLDLGVPETVRCQS